MNPAHQHQDAGIFGRAPQDLFQIGQGLLGIARPQISRAEFEKIAVRRVDVVARERQAQTRRKARQLAQVRFDLLLVGLFA